jgi:hypothetical protein
MTKETSVDRSSVHNGDWAMAAEASMPAAKDATPKEFMQPSIAPH